ncbi:RND transporter [Solibacillus isronensis]|uniref:RND transporter n=1 Tax=Solibacillus isronensis TaxID=412383 RepID=UPI00203BEC64|nr:RND transporter [Solibacillus isronensis]MCM3721524.1 RND transporter [Solibacillus isronensis]
MKSKKIIKTINWVTFIIILLVGFFTAGFSLYDLSTQVALGEEGQSRAGFRWGIFHIIILVIIVMSAAFLGFTWKILFPFNVPIAIIIAGLCYQLFFLTFTIGWIGLNGTFGFVIAFLIGIILIISYTVLKFLESRKRSETN